MATEDILNANPQLEVGPPTRMQDEPEDRLINWIQKELAGAKTHVDKFQGQYREARRFRDGKQLSDSDYRELRDKQRPTNAFNSAQKFIRFVTGIEREAPEALVFSPRVEDNELQQALGELVTRGYDWAIEKAFGNFERSRAFEDLLVGGMGWQDYYIDRGRDPKGLLATTRISPLEMIWPDCDRQNLEGTRWRARESWIDKDEAIARWPEDKPLIQAAAGGGGGDGEQDRDHPEVASIVIYTVPYIETKPIDQEQPEQSVRNKVKILEFQWFDDDEGYYFYDPLEKEDTWMASKTFKIYRDRLPKMTGLDIEDYVRQAQRVHKKVFLLNRKHILGEEMKMIGNRFTFNCMTGSFDEEERTWYGFFRVLIDPQKYANKFFNQVIEIMGTSSKGGLLYEKGAVKPNQIDAIEEDYAKPGTSQEVAEGAISGNKLKFKELPQLPTASMTVMDFCIKAMDQVTGISPDSAFGQGMQGVPGITLRQRKKSSVVLLAGEFDALSRYRIDEGYIVFDFLKTLADDRLIRVGGPMDGQVIRLMREPFTEEYDLSLDDTERDPSIRAEYEQNIMAIAPILIRNKKFYPVLLDYMRLPYRFKQKVKQVIAEDAKQEQQAAQQGIPRGGGRGQPQSPQERQAKIDKLEADTAVQMAKVERIKSQTQRDQAKMILEAIVKNSQMKIDKDRFELEKSHGTLDLYHKATGKAMAKEKRI